MWATLNNYISKHSLDKQCSRIEIYKRLGLAKLQRDQAQALFFSTPHNLLHPCQEGCFCTQRKPAEPLDAWRDCQASKTWDHYQRQSSEFFYIRSSWFGGIKGCPLQTIERRCQTGIQDKLCSTKLGRSDQSWSPGWTHFAEHPATRVAIGCVTWSKMSIPSSLWGGAQNQCLASPP